MMIWYWFATVAVVALTYFLLLGVGMFSVWFWLQVF